MTKTIIWYNNF